MHISVPMRFRHLRTSNASLREKLLDVEGAIVILYYKALCIIDSIIIIIIGKRCGILASAPVRNTENQT